MDFFFLKTYKISNATVDSSSRIDNKNIDPSIT